jgi:hypothetical protein
MGDTSVSRGIHRPDRALRGLPGHRKIQQERTCTGPRFARRDWRHASGAGRHAFTVWPRATLAHNWQ